MGTVPSASRPRSGSFSTALASSAKSGGRWIALTSKGRRTESKQRRLPFKLTNCGEGPGAAAGDDRTRQRPQGCSSRQLFARSGTEVGEQLGGTATSFSPCQTSHSRTPAIVPQCWRTAPQHGGAPHASQQRSPDPPHQPQLGDTCSFEHRKRDDRQRIDEGRGWSCCLVSSHGQRWGCWKALTANSNAGEVALQPSQEALSQRSKCSLAPVPQFGKQRR